MIYRILILIALAISVLLSGCISNTNSDKLKLNEIYFVVDVKFHWNANGEPYYYTIKYTNISDNFKTKKIDAYDSEYTDYGSLLNTAFVTFTEDNQTYMKVTNINKNNNIVNITIYTNQKLINKWAIDS